MRLADGRHVCDCCGTDVGGGGVAQCVVVSDLDREERGRVLNRHFCRDRTEGDGEDTQEIKGCEHKLLNPATIRYYTQQKEAAASA